MGSSSSNKVKITQQCCSNYLCSPQPQVFISTYIVQHQKTNQTNLHPNKLIQIRDSILTDLKQTSSDKSKIQRLQTAVSYAKLLQLRVVRSPVLPKNLSIPITAQGYQPSYRGAQDGNVYFGCKKHLNGQIINDFIIKIPDNRIAENHRGQHFVVSYEVDLDLYFIKDLQAGFATFVKIQEGFRIKENSLIQMGDNFLLFHLSDIIETGESKVRVKLFGPSIQGEMFYFNAREHQSKAVLIGRGKRCQIRVSDSLISKVQACLVYEEGWVLEDGDQGKPSTNGTWLYLSEWHQLSTGMVFKNNQTIFQVFLM